MTTANLGAPVVIEATVQSYTPFGAYANADPDAVPKISVYDNKGKKVVDAQDMTKNATGEYFYTVQSLTTWKKGLYRSEITAAFAPNSTVECDVESFTLE